MALGSLQRNCNGGREEVELYQMFDEKGNFTLKDLKERAKRLLETQDSIMTIFNTPAHNPSGYTMTDEDWQEIMDFL